MKSIKIFHNNNKNHLFQKKIIKDILLKQYKKILDGSMMKQKLQVI